MPRPPPLRMEKRLVACSHRASELGVRAGARVPWQGHEDLRGGAGRSGSRVAAWGSLAPKSLPPPSFQLSDLVCGLTASGAHSGSLFSVTLQASPQTALLHDPLSCRPQTGTASQHPAASSSHRGDGVKNQNCVLLTFHPAGPTYVRV